MQQDRFSGISGLGPLELGVGIAASLADLYALCPTGPVDDVLDHFCNLHGSRDFHRCLYLLVWAQGLVGCGVGVAPSTWLLTHLAPLCSDRFPFYYEIKMAFVLWLLSPYTKGASLLYRKFVHPSLSRHEKVTPETGGNGGVEVGGREGALTAGQDTWALIPGLLLFSYGTFPGPDLPCLLG
jgi:hypothetical protein